MKKDPAKELFKAAATEPKPLVPGDFSGRVMREIARPTERASSSLFEQINTLFPRLALGAALAIVLLLAGELVANSLSSTSLSEDLAQVSEQWFYPDDPL